MSWKIWLQTPKKKKKTLSLVSWTFIFPIKFVRSGVIKSFVTQLVESPSIFNENFQGLKLLFLNYQNYKKLKIKKLQGVGKMRFKYRFSSWETN